MVTSKTHWGPDLLTTCPPRLRVFQEPTPHRWRWQAPRMGTLRSPSALITFTTQSNAVRGEHAHFTGEKTELRVPQSLGKGLQGPQGRRKDGVLLNFNPLTGTLTQSFLCP